MERFLEDLGIVNVIQNYFFGVLMRCEPGREPAADQTRRQEKANIYFFSQKKVYKYDCFADCHLLKTID